MLKQIVKLTKKSFLLRCDQYSFSFPLKVPVWTFTAVQRDFVDNAGDKNGFFVSKDLS